MTTYGRVTPAKGEVVMWLINVDGICPEGVKSIQFHILDRDNIFVNLSQRSLLSNELRNSSEGYKWMTNNQKINGWKCDLPWLFVTLLNGSPEVMVKEI